MNNRKKGGFGIIMLSILLIAAAVLGGAVLAKSARSGPARTDGSALLPAIGQNGDGQNTGGADGDKGAGAGVIYGAETALSMTPVDVIFDVNSETGRVENIYVEILRCNEGALDYIRLAPEISHTLSGSLYRELTVDNPELPQMVTLSEIYRYYHSDKAYEAGMKIVSEMLNFTVHYYAAFVNGEMNDLISVSESAEEITMGFRIDRDDAVSEKYGTPGSVKGIIEHIMKRAVTNRGASERLRYLEVYDGLDSGSVNFHAVPVIEHNESCELDYAGAGAVLYRILY